MDSHDWEQIEDDARKLKRRIMKIMDQDWEKHSFELQAGNDDENNTKN